MPGRLVADWLKRRLKELLRAGRVSGSAAVAGCMPGMLGVVVLAGTGKSLRLGSKARLLAKSSKLTEGRKSKEPAEPVLSRSALAGSGCLEKLKRGLAGAARVEGSEAGVGRKERPSTEGTPGAPATPPMPATPAACALLAILREPSVSISV